MTCLLTPHNLVGPVAPHLPGSTKSPERCQGFPESVQPLAGHSRPSGGAGEQTCGPTVSLLDVLGGSCWLSYVGAGRTGVLLHLTLLHLTLLHPHPPPPSRPPSPVAVVATNGGLLTQGAPDTGGLLTWGAPDTGGAPDTWGLPTQGAPDAGGLLMQGAPNTRGAPDMGDSRHGGAPDTGGFRYGGLLTQVAPEWGSS